MLDCGKTSLLRKDLRKVGGKDDKARVDRAQQSSQHILIGQQTV